MSTENRGVETPTPSEREATRRYHQYEMDKVKPSEFDGKVKVQFSGEGKSKHLNITATQYEAIKKIIAPEPASPVSYNPCLQGKVLIDGAESDFLISLEHDSVGFSQWGAPNEVLWSRVALLDGLSGEAREWWAANKPEEDGND